MLALVAMVLAGAASQADVYSWVSWNSPSGNTVTGTIATNGGPVGVTLTGPFNNVYTSYPSWTPASTWADGTIVSNAPDNTSIIQLINAGRFSLSFDKSVSDLAFCVWSVGQGGVPITYAFDHNLTYVSGGPSAEYGGISITTTANTLTGVEGNGTVLFQSPMTTLNFETIGNENWHGFNLGLKHDQPVPEPATLAVLGLGAAALPRRRRR